MCTSITSYNNKYVFLLTIDYVKLKFKIKYNNHKFDLSQLVVMEFFWLIINMTMVFE